MDSKIIEIINTILANKGIALKSTITNTSLLREDIGFDSFDLAELTVRIEDEFDVDIFKDGIVNTVEEIFQKLQKK